ncbi:hypothetical protein DL767_010943 [Monosporascus sp. MG133]|nr:hypothetical protein DL767_010943 [Monosporascus sp. MG133]
MLNVNVIGTFNCLEEEMKDMKRGSSILNCGIQQVRHASWLMSAYAASKNAVRGLSQAAAYEGGPKGIRVNPLCPSTQFEHQASLAKGIIFHSSNRYEVDMTVLLEIPRELRDLIIRLVLLSGRPAPIDYRDASRLTRAPIEDVYFASWHGSSGIRYEPKSTTPAATPLLLVNRQLHLETKHALERIPERGRSYSLDLMLVKEELLWPTWTLVPAYAQHVDSVDVRVRVVGASAMRVLPGFHKWNQWHSIFAGGDGGPPLAVWLFYSVLERFLKAGPVGRTLDPKLGEYRRSGRCYSEEEATKLGSWELAGLVVYASALRFGA